MKNEPLIWVIVAVVLLVLIFSGVGMGFGGYGGMMGFGGTSGYGGMMGMMYGTYGSGMMFFGWLYGILILIALILFIAWLVQQIQKK